MGADDRSLLSENNQVPSMSLEAQFQALEKRLEKKTNDLFKSTKREIMQALENSTRMVLAASQQRDIPRYLLAIVIVNQAYKDTFVTLTKCPEDMDIKTCFNQTSSKAQGRSWWFHTMLRDAATRRLWRMALPIGTQCDIYWKRHSQLHY
jgi:hypothetical protein